MPVGSGWRYRSPKEPPDLPTKAIGESGPVGGGPGSEIDALIKRVSGLQETVEELKKGK